MARIRYSKPDVDGVSRSVKSYYHPTNGAKYYLNVNTKQNTWSVHDHASDTLVDSGRASSPHKVMKQSREALEKLGVILLVDERAKHKKVA